MCSQSVASCLDARFRWIAIYEYRTHTHFNFMRWSNTVTRRSHPNTCQPDNTNRKLILILTHTMSHTHTHMFKSEFSENSKAQYTHIFVVVHTMDLSNICIYKVPRSNTHTLYQMYKRMSAMSKRRHRSFGISL